MSAQLPTMSQNTRRRFLKWNPYGWDQLVEASNEGFFSERKGFEKTEFLTNTSGIYQIVYGKMAWDWVNREHNAFSLLPKVPWGKSGERIITGDPATAAFQGLAENGSLPTAQVPNYATHSTKFKQCVSRFQLSRKLIMSQAFGDDVLSDEDMRTWAMREHALGIETAICENAEATCASYSTTQAYAGKDTFEALDRILAAGEEEDDVGKGVNEYDPWQQYAGTAWDRDSGTTYDCILVHGDGTYVAGSRSAFGTDSTLTLEALDILIRETQKAGADPAHQIMITGYDTYYRIKQLIETKQRFMDSARVVRTVNGVSTVEGHEAGFPVATYEGIPIFKARNCPADTLSRIFLLDTRYIFFKVVTPTVLMTPDETESYIGLGKLIHDHWFLTEGETWCTNIKVQGKLRSAS